VPISCTELQVQVGALKLYGLSQLLLLAAAAAEGRPAHAGASTSAGGAAVSTAGAAVARRPAGKSRKPPAGQVLEAVAWMPEKVGSGGSAEVVVWQ
jgi:hypothetical protein